VDHICLHKPQASERNGSGLRQRFLQAKCSGNEADNATKQRHNQTKLRMHQTIHEPILSEGIRSANWFF